MRTPSLLALFVLLVPALPAARDAARFDPRVTGRAAAAAMVLSGRVTDSASGAALEGAQVHLAGTGYGAVTRANGRYTFTVTDSTLRGPRRLQARRIGYAGVDRVVRLDRDTVVVDFAMSPTSTFLSAQTIVTPAVTPAERKARSATTASSAEARALPAPSTTGVLSLQQTFVGTARSRTAGNVGDVSNALRGAAVAGGIGSIGGIGYARDANTAGRRRLPDDTGNTENYATIDDNPFLGVAGHPMSTFSVDVDRASYGNVRRFILGQGQRPPKDAVRIEELVNYFPYSYPSPRGEEPFSVTTEVAAAPWNARHQLVRVGLQAKKVETAALPPVNLVFLIDVSGSMMEPSKLPLVKEGFRMLVDQLREQDRVAIVVYAGRAGLVLPPTSGANKERIVQAIDALEAGGSTAGGAGIELAYDVAKQNFRKGGANRVILATDGDFNVGVSSDAALVRLVERRRTEGTFLTVLGFGTGNLKDSRMEQLADKGNGHYAYVDDALEAKKVFVTELGGTLVTVAKDVKLQVEFNPARVGAYRLIGYENRLLQDEDFNDDAKDAGEIGAGHAVTALYEIVPRGLEEEVLRSVDAPRYERPSAAPTSGSALSASTGDELMNVKIRYKRPDGERSLLLSHAVVARAVEHPSDDFTFAAAVAEFGMSLRESPYRGTATLSSAAALARRSLGSDAGGYRAEFLRMVEAANGREVARKE